MFSNSAIVADFTDGGPCIFCNSCVRACAAQNCHVYSPGNRKEKVHPSVNPRQILDIPHPSFPGEFHQPVFETGVVSLDASNCMGCGQCAVACPTGAISVQKADLDIAKDLLKNKRKRTVALIAPSVRVGLAEAYGLPAGTVCTRSTVKALRELGFDTVFDVNMGADQTVFEDLAEFREAFKKREPLFTSCCPAWVKFAEMNLPEALPHISTARSCVAMVAALVRRKWSVDQGLKPEDVSIITIMPCTAKKHECRRPQLSGEHGRDIDASLTVIEAAELLRQNTIEVEEDSDKLGGGFDEWAGLSSGAAAIFGRGKGVAEAVIRLAAAQDGTEFDPHLDWVEKEIANAPRGHSFHAIETLVGGHNVRVAAVSGGAGLRAVLQELEADPRAYDLIEVMMCPGGCSGGAGLIKKKGVPPIAASKARAGGLDTIDAALAFTSSADNDNCARVYESDLDDEEVHEVLHTHFTSY